MLVLHSCIPFLAINNKLFVCSPFSFPLGNDIRIEYILRKVFGKKWFQSSQGEKCALSPHICYHMTAYLGNAECM